MGSSFKILRLICLVIMAILPIQQTKADFGLDSGAHFGYGEMGNVTQTLGDRSTSTIDLQLIPGYTLYGVIGGILLEYRLVSQLEDSRIFDTNLSGNTVAIGPAVDYKAGSWRLMASWLLYVRHSLRDLDRKYKGSGYELLVGYDYFYGLTFDVSFSSISYGSYTSEIGKVDITDNALKQWNLAFGVGYRF